MPSYYLSHHTFLCLSDNQYVFLDLRNDKYLSLDAKTSNALQRLLEEKKTHRPDSEPIGDGIPSEQKNTIHPIAHALIKNGLLTQDFASGKAALPMVVTVPNSDLTGYALSQKPTIRCKHIARLFKASLLSTARLRFYPLEQVIERVRRRKNRDRKYTPEANSQQVRELVEVFKLLRPLLFTARNHCLYDALVLIEFLACYRIFPTWVFGVQMGPFRAHCWVQNEHFILNSSVAGVASYTPILTI